MQNVAGTKPERKSGSPLTEIEVLSADPDALEVAVYLCRPDGAGNQVRSISQILRHDAARPYIPEAVVESEHVREIAC